MKKLFKNKAFGGIAIAVIIGLSAVFSEINESRRESKIDELIKKLDDANLNK